MNRRYHIGTGYVGSLKHPTWKERLIEMWRSNNCRTADPLKMTILAMVGTVPPKLDGVDVMQVTGDVGSCGMLLSGEKTYPYNGCAIAIMTLALIAYADEADFIYKEQDCLAFGPWVEQLYLETGDRGMLIGRPVESFPSAMSLVLIRHDFILDFVRGYLATPPEHNPQNLTEHKFTQIREMFPKRVGVMSFGYDRNRPINYNDKVFYLQQTSEAEMDELKRRGLL